MIPYMWAFSLSIKLDHHNIHKNKKKKKKMDKLPVEIIQSIINYTDLQTKLALQQCCIFLRELIAPLVWQNMVFDLSLNHHHHHHFSRPTIEGHINIDHNNLEQLVKMLSNSNSPIYEGFKCVEKLTIILGDELDIIIGMITPSYFPNLQRMHLITTDFDHYSSFILARFENCDKMQKSLAINNSNTLPQLTIPESIETVEFCYNTLLKGTFHSVKTLRLNLLTSMPFTQLHFPNLENLYLDCRAVSLTKLGDNTPLKLKQLCISGMKLSKVHNLVDNMIITETLILDNLDINTTWRSKNLNFNFNKLTLTPTIILRFNGSWDAWRLDVILDAALTSSSASTIYLCGSDEMNKLARRMRLNEYVLTAPNPNELLMGGGGGGPITAFKISQTNETL